MSDSVGILVEKFAGVLLRAGKDRLTAYIEAEEIAQAVLGELDAIGAPVGRELRQVRVYDLRTRGIDPAVIMKRLGIGRTQVFRDYKRELDRRRYAA